MTHVQKLQFAVETAFVIWFAVWFVRHHLVDEWNGMLNRVDAFLERLEKRVENW
jgi:hypothetical protein